MLAFYLWEFTDSIPVGMERRMNQQTKKITNFAFIATLVVIASVGFGLLIFHFSYSQDWLAQWLRGITM